MADPLSIHGVDRFSDWPNRNQSRDRMKKKPADGETASPQPNDIQDNSDTKPEPEPDYLGTQINLEA